MPFEDHLGERPSHIVLSFVDERVAAKAWLLWDRAPEVCQAVIDVLPLRVLSHHGIYSGSEIAAVTPQLPRLPQNGGTTDVEVGDVAYAHLRAEEHYGVDEDFSEICWFYDLDARPRMFDVPVKVVVFAHIEGSAEFFAVSRKMRLEGAKPIELTLS